METSLKNVVHAPMVHAQLTSEIHAQEAVAAISAVCTRMRGRLAPVHGAIRAEDCAAFLREGVRSLLSTYLELPWLPACMAAYDTGLADVLRVEHVTGVPIQVPGWAAAFGPRHVPDAVLLRLREVGREHGQWVVEMTSVGRHAAGTAPSADASKA